MNRFSHKLNLEAFITAQVSFTSVCFRFCDFISDKWIETTGDAEWSQRLALIPVSFILFIISGTIFPDSSYGWLSR